MAIACVSLQTGLLLVLCICSTLQLGTVMADKRTVLVSMEGRNRVVDFCGQAGTDRSALTAAVKMAFSDVLCGQEFFLQIKDEEWGGAFVELTEDMAVPDKSVVEAKRIEVCYSHVLCI